MKKLFKNVCVAILMATMVLFFTANKVDASIKVKENDVEPYDGTFTSAVVTIGEPDADGKRRVEVKFSSDIDTTADYYTSHWQPQWNVVEGHPDTVYAVFEKNVHTAKIERVISDGTTTTKEIGIIQIPYIFDLKEPVEYEETENQRMYRKSGDSITSVEDTTVAEVVEKEGKNYLVAKKVGNTVLKGYHKVTIADEGECLLEYSWPIVVVNTTENTNQGGDGTTGDNSTGDNSTDGNESNTDNKTDEEKSKSESSEDKQKSDTADGPHANTGDNYIFEAVIAGAVILAVIIGKKLLGTKIKD